MKGRWWHLPLGLAISVVFLWLAARNLDWTAFWSNLSRVSYSNILLGALLITTACSLRAVRWQAFFRTDEAPSWWLSMRVVLIGYAGNNILPARAGEVLRAHCLGVALGTSRSRVLATIVLERIFDVLALLVLFVVALAVLGRRMPAIQQMSAVVWLALGMIVVLAGLMILWRWKGHTSADSENYLASKAHQFVQGLHSLGHGATMIRVVVLSLVVWLLDASAYWAIMSAFPVAVPWDAALAVNVFGNLATMIPSGPAAVGTFEFAVVQVLKPWNFDASLAFGMAVVIHLVQFTLTTSTGLMAYAGSAHGPPTAENGLNAAQAGR